MILNDRVLHHIVTDRGLALDIVAHLLSWTPSEVEFLFQLGSIYCNRKRVKAQQWLEVGDYLRVHKKPRRFVLKYELKDRVLHEDDHYVVLDKPGGIPCHSTVDNTQENLVAWWNQLTGQNCQLTHRLDIGTSGCLVIAKNRAASSEFNKLIAERTKMSKIYECAVEGRVEIEGLITHYMENSLWAPKTVSAEAREGWLECRLRILERKFESAYTLLKIELETGRTHQIRTQMAALGHPVLNDHMYGAQKMMEKERFALCAKEIRYINPFTQNPQIIRARSHAFEDFEL